MRFAIYSSVAVAIGLGASPARAEDEAAPIVVTGQQQRSDTGSKTGTDPRDIPAAVVVIEREVLAQQDVRTLDDALRNASAVTPVFGGGYGLSDNYLIRGLPMRFLRDGLPDGPTFVGYRRTLADVASIEVLKGPGSALYGRAEAGGSVNLTTLAPLDEFGARGEASVGRFGSTAFTADVTGPLGGGASARLIGNLERTDGYRGLARRFVDVLPGLSADLGDHRVTLDYDHRDQRLTVDNYGIPFTVAGRLAPVDRQARFYSPFNRVEQVIDRVTLSDTARVHPALQLRAALSYDTRDVAITRNAGGNVVNAAGVMTGRNGRTQRDAAEYWTAQFEAVASVRTGTVGHTALLGAEYADFAVDTRRVNYALPNVVVAGGTARAPETGFGVTTPAFDRRIRSRTLSLYGQDQVELGRTVKLRAGVRYDAVELVDDGVQGARRRRIAGSPDLLSYQVGAVWQPAAWLSLYGGTAHGRFVSVQTESQSLSPIPETSDQVEAGVKTAFLDGRLRADLAVFETRRDDYFVTLVPGGDPVQAGRQRSRGVELDIGGSPHPGLTLIANAAYVDARNRSAALSSLTGIASNQSVAGNRLPSTPRWSGSVWAAFEVPGGALRGLSLGGGLFGKGAVFVDQLERLRVPGYRIARAALAYRFGPVQAQVTVENLGNARYFTVPTFVGALPGEPRSVKLTVRAGF